MQFTQRLCFTKQPISGQTTLSWSFLYYLTSLFLKLKIHLCNDAISLTSLVSSSEFNCFYIYLLLCSYILFNWTDRCNPKIHLHDPNKIHYSRSLLSY